AALRPFAPLQERLELMLQLRNPPPQLSVLGFEFGDPLLAWVVHDPCSLRETAETGKRNCLTVTSFTSPQAAPPGVRKSFCRSVMTSAVRGGSITMPGLDNVIVSSFLCDVLDLGLACTAFSPPPRGEGRRETFNCGGVRRWSRRPGKPQREAAGSFC